MEGLVHQSQSEMRIPHVFARLILSIDCFLEPGRDVDASTAATVAKTSATGEESPTTSLKPAAVSSSSPSKLHGKGQGKGFLNKVSNTPATGQHKKTPASFLSPVLENGHVTGSEAGGSTSTRRKKGWSDVFKKAGMILVGQYPESPEEEQATNAAGESIAG